MSVLDTLADRGVDLRRPHHGENRAPCPRCDRGDRDDALAVKIEDSAAVFVCHRCGWTGAVKEAERTGRIDQHQHQHQPQRQPNTNHGSYLPPVGGARSVPDRNRIHPRARLIWIESVPIAGTLGADYLLRRGCALPPADGDLRFHPAVYCSDVKREMPALVARVSTVTSNRGVGIHRIYLDPKGGTKAIAKKRLGGCDEPVCIRLFPDVETGLAITEGIESALAVARVQRPVWAAIDAGQLERFPVLAGIDSLTVYADHDDRGIEAATACVRRWREAWREATGVAPSTPGEDFADVVARGDWRCRITS